MDPSFFEGVKKILGVGSEEKKELVDPYLVLKFAGKKVIKRRAVVIYTAKFLFHLSLHCTVTTW